MIGRINNQKNASRLREAVPRKCAQFTIPIFGRVATLKE
jgi:hypothetical protein